MGIGIVGVEPDGALQQLKGRLVVRLGRAMMAQLAGEHALIGRHALGRLVDRAVMHGRLDASRQGRDHRCGHLVLDCEDVRKLAVIAVGPDMAIGFGIDELDGDAHPIARLAYAAFDQIVDRKLLGDLFHVDRLALVSGRGIAGDDQEISEARELGDDVFGQSIGEKFLLGIAAHIGEGQDDDRRFVALLAVIRTANRPAFGSDAIDPHGLGEVLDLLLAQIAKAKLEFGGDMLVGSIGEADAPRLRQPFQPGREIDAVAVEIAALDDYIAQVHANAQHDLLVLREGRIGGAHGLLNIHGALHGANHALELDQHAIAHQLEDPAAVTGDLRLHHLAAAAHQCRQRPRLVLAHESAVAHHIGCQDRRQAAF